MRLFATCLAATALLVACRQEPRAVEFFEANPGPRSEVLADCKLGNHRGAECDNARLAQQIVAAKTRRQRTIEMLEKQIEN